MACCTILKGARNHANSKAWHIDSGASDHISNLKSNFVNLKHLDIPIRIRMGNNALIIATEIGSVLLTTAKNGKLRYIMLFNVLYAPNLRTNLLSVSKMNENRYNVLFFHQEYTTILDEHGNLSQLRQ